ncbi:cobaltochelatase subunit CobN [Psychromonas sp. psych-6C06]|uniref:cobaltochelatase subunit CobN n=1 Tax=Psychromonas sp. psych-6C06 TaxID=2058089 RepID=UPI000C31D5B4|nr:cobaltochelatase subunit CobN [Psychromonas sp. psych-6C06]PKF61604.1 cobaltochelatase subunit CobN [Psychromonas sp. psych-6C06]
MHLLAAQPGGFTEQEGIVDLAQSPAPMVVFSAADSQLTALSAGYQQASDACIEQSPLVDVRLVNWTHLLKPAAFDLYEHKVLQHTTLVVVSLLGGKAYWEYGVERLLHWAEELPERTLILVPGDDHIDPQLVALSNCSASQQQQVWRYFRAGGIENSQQLFIFLNQHYFAHKPVNAIKDAQFLPVAQLYKASTESWVEGQPVVALLFYRSHLQSANCQMFEQLIALMSKQGLNPLPIVISSLKDKQALDIVNQLLCEHHCSLILNSTGFASNSVSTPTLSSQPNSFKRLFNRDVPILQLVLSSSTLQDWTDYKQGLRSRDIAMQVVLPEMDGKVLTRAISFKSETYYDAKTEISLVQYQLHPERALFVIELAKKYVQLAKTENKNKRIALILANYPTKDGRIGNGVGLDTPNSTINILKALKAADYPVGNVPDNGNQLIEQLLQSVTNNPNTLHHLACWQSLSLSDYKKAFATLPSVSQQAINDRWGRPEEDIKCRDGRLMIAGIRLGETFVGIQPARGFNIDLLANYHDPDLVPPHNYLAFYFWLRFQYQVNAVIHVGKHGNLEWLPGKGLALSNECWPDAVLGPMPHFYPFIVNDPGEGAQAKRRTQAVIIDHLMPPMTRAETYGELAELEGLVDEYYQAQGLDIRREQWLREQILSKVQDTHILDELNDTAREDDGQVLEQLDTYLCDIKEAQIRHGLHILGQLPEAHKVANTLVALLRLPRGEGAINQGILHCLVDDFALRCDANTAFDPLTSSREIWSGEKPILLAQISDALWRSHADTRERLELVALDWVQRYLIETQDLQALNAYPATQQLFFYAQSTIKKALQQSVENEMSAIIDGLAAKFIDAGPSGAPTRGRLDTLPTGRNFYSVDNRAIPSKAAWVLGQQSAQALLHRHLQEHGDYPKQLGLSVWGTATMRTGGDDIAQAFALMGIKPIWAQGSHRVIDFEIIPCQLLGRPRVDVTLRVSGFFRDAFANVMALFDAAVVAISELDEPGNGNIIKQHISQREAQLIADGVAISEAKRQASYRVFGSKPGAYGAGLQGLIDERCWEKKSDLAEAYLNWGGYAYGNSGKDGVQAKNAFLHQLSHLDVVVQNQDNREHDLLDSDDYYQFQGGMSNAVQVYSGSAPSIYHSDHSNPSKPVIRTLKEELNRVLRSRVLNPKWIEAMREHGYKGAFEMGATVDYLFAYDATTDLIADYQYQQVTDTLLLDETNQQFLRDNNPQIMEEMAERLMEAMQRGLWQAPEQYQQQLQDLLLACDEMQESK